MRVRTFLFTLGLALALAAPVAVLFPPPAAAHPHVFVDNTVTFVFDGKGLAGIRLFWLFDDMFGTQIREDFDTDSDGAFSPAEIAAVRQGAFDNLKNFDYFTFIQVDGQPFKVSRVQHFSAGFRSGQLYYEFFVPCPVPAGNASHSLRLRVQDPEYYADIYTPEEAAPGLENAGEFKAETRVALNPHDIYSSFQVWCTDITLDFSPK